MKQGSARPGVAAILALGVLLSLGAPAHSTTIPLPTGVVTGSESVSEVCEESGSFGVCHTYTTFQPVRAIGRLTSAGKGVQVVVRAKRIRFVSDIRYCLGYPPCELSIPPALTEPFELTGSTIGGQAFEATCSSGDFSNPLADSDLGIGPVVSAYCSGGTPNAQGSFAFRFLFPVTNLSSMLANALAGRAPFAAVLVETR